MRLLNFVMVVAGALVLLSCVKENADVTTPSNDGTLEMDASIAGGETDGGVDDPNGPDGAGADGADAGEQEMSTPCREVCERALECAEMVCPDAGRGFLSVSCNVACEREEDFVAGAEERESCEELLPFVSARSDDFRNRCRAESGNACDDFGLLGAECLQRACPAARELDEGAFGLMRNLCRGLISNGTWAEGQVAASLERGCDGGLIGGAVSFITVRQRDPNSGGLEAFCRDGAVLSSDTCHEGCVRLAECIPDDAAPDQGGWANDYPTCRNVCGLVAEPDAGGWECVADAADCDAVFQCFTPQPPPELPTCARFGDVVSGCVAERCEASAAVSRIVRDIAARGCDGTVANGDLGEDTFSEQAEAADCGSPLLRNYANFFLARNPDDPNAGALTLLCSEDGPAATELCEGQCVRVDACVPDDPEDPNLLFLKDEQQCLYWCVSTVGEWGRAWRECIPAAQECDDIFACFPQGG